MTLEGIPRVTYSRRPYAFARVGVGLIVLGAPVLRVNLGTPWADILPPSAESRQGWDLVADEIGPGELAPLLVVVTSAGLVICRTEAVIFTTLIVGVCIFNISPASNTKRLLLVNKFSLASVVTVIFSHSKSVVEEAS